MTTINNKLMAGNAVFGPFIKAGNPGMIEILGYSGFDYVLLDMEHSPFSMEHVEHLIRAAEIGGICPFIRVSSHSESAVLHPLDKGAKGLLVPMVNDRETARRIVEYAKFSPQGRRGMDIYSRAARFGYVGKKKHFEQSNSDILIAVQIEGKQGLDNLDDILTVDGVDIIYVGPYDLSQSLGIPGEVNDPRVVNAVKTICDKAAAAGRCTGVYVDNVQTAKKYQALGVQFITLSVDVTIFFRACDQIMEQLRNL